MESVFHEKQEGSLCAQHCLNTLLQGPYYSAVDLGQLAEQLDEEERQRMAEAGVESAEYLRFMQGGSSNMDDSGFFSVQVLSRALEVWTLELVPYRSRSHEVAERARSDPCTQKAFICNFREHWFAVRKLGYQWFNLNSLLSAPELISDTYLALFLAQLEKEGYSIFVVNGLFPDCTADEILKVTPAVQARPPSLLSASRKERSGAGASQGSARSEDADAEARGSSPAMDDEQMQRVLAESRAEFEGADPTLQRVMRETAHEQEESDLELALALSRAAAGPEPQPKKDNESAKKKGETIERKQLEEAIALSMQAADQNSDVDSTEQSGDSGQQPTPEEIRERRRNFLDRFN